MGTMFYNDKTIKWGMLGILLSYTGSIGFTNKKYIILWYNGEKYGEN